MMNGQLGAKSDLQSNIMRVQDCAVAYILGHVIMAMGLSWWVFIPCGCELKVCY